MNPPDCFHRKKINAANSTCFCNSNHFVGTPGIVPLSKCVKCGFVNLDNRVSNTVPSKSQPKELGDLVESALTTIGITSKRVSRWLGRPCRCNERRLKLNRLSRIAKRVLAGKIGNHKKNLEDLMEEK